MINGTVVIEPSDSAIKIVVGNVLNNTPIILYANTFPVSGLIKSGNIIDVKNLSNIFHNISYIEDKKARIRFSIKSAVLVLPPLGFDVFTDKKTTNVISNLSRIETFDLDNVMMMLKNSPIGPNNSIVDIIPLTYYLDRGCTDKTPIGMTSKFLAMSALIYTLPKKIVKTYCSSIEIAGIRTKKVVLSSSAIAKLMSREKDLPFAYIYVDIGSSYTSLSIIAKTHVYGVSCINIGGDELTQRISDKFRINTTEAEKIKRRYGYSKRVISFDPTISEFKDIDGAELVFKISDLNNIMKEYFDEFFMQFNSCLEKLVMSYPEDKRNFPLIIGGCASRLEGFIDVFKEKYADRSVSKIPLNVIGTRHEKYLNCIGALMVYEESISAKKEVAIKNDNLNTNRRNLMDALNN